LASRGGRQLADGAREPGDLAGGAVAVEDALRHRLVERARRRRERLRGGIGVTGGEGGADLSHEVPEAGLDRLVAQAALLALAVALQRRRMIGHGGASLPRG